MALWSIVVVLVAVGWIAIGYGMQWLETQPYNHDESEPDEPDRSG